MAYTKIFKYETLRTFDSSTFSGSYQAIGTPFLHPASLVRMYNASGVIVSISEDGVNAHDIIPINGFWLYDITANTPAQGDDAVFIPQGTQYFVSGVASTGLVYLVVKYIVQV